MSFNECWHMVLDACEDFSAEATLIAPLSERRFRITDVQDDQLVIEFADSESSRPLPRDQVEALYDRVTDSTNGFDLENLPRGTEPYAAVLSLHPQYEVDERAGVMTDTEGSTTTQMVDEPQDGEEIERVEPDIEVYSDALLLIDALEHRDPDALEDLETPALVNLYTLLADVQRGANDLRKEVSEELLERVHHDQPVHGQFGSIQRTSRRRRTLKEDDEVLTVLEEAGIPRKRVMSVDRNKVDDALDVIELEESEVYDIEEGAYMRKAEVDEEVKESRLQGLKDRLAMSDDSETDELRSEIEELEDRIEELTEFKSGKAFSMES